MTKAPLPQHLKDKADGLNLKPGVYTLEYIFCGSPMHPPKNLTIHDLVTQKTYTFVVPEEQYLTHGNGD